MCRLVRGELPVKPASIQLLKQLMETRGTPQGTLYGKTGSGSSADGRFNLGWFVGFCESGGRTFAFATQVQGGEISGADARILTETILQRLGLL
jgi:beta-lactamase class D